MLCYNVAKLTQGSDAFPLKVFIPFHPPSFARCIASTFFYSLQNKQKSARPVTDRAARISGYAVYACTPASARSREAICSPSSAQKVFMPALRASAGRPKKSLLD